MKTSVDLSNQFKKASDAQLSQMLFKDDPRDWTEDALAAASAEWTSRGGTKRIWEKTRSKERLRRRLLIAICIALFLVQGPGAFFAILFPVAPNEELVAIAEFSSFVGAITYFAFLAILIFCCAAPNRRRLFIGAVLGVIGPSLAVLARPLAMMIIRSFH